MTHPQPGEKYLHLKTGGVYEVIGCGLNESDHEVQVIYSKDPRSNEPWWIRPAAQFMDGRFQLVVAAKG